MDEQSAKPDRIVAEIAARQHGVVSYAQLSAAGVTRTMITIRVQAGRLHRTHRGVYAVGNPNLTREGHWMAAVLACGKEAVLSHQSAAALWGISPTSPSFVHITVPGSNGRATRRGVVLHRSRTLRPGDTTRRRGIPVTSHARTLRDLGYGLEPTRSGLERAFLRLCREHGVPKPEVNVRLGPYVVDFLWRSERLVVETDSYRYHSNRATFRSDRARDRELKRRGFTVFRVSDEELADSPAAVVASVRDHLRKASDPGPRMGFR